MVDDNELRKIICYKIGKFSGEELTEDDLLSVRDIGISGKKLNGERNSINMQELRKLPNLEMLTLQQIELDNNLIGIINSIPKLKSLMIARCDVKPHTNINIGNINSLTINGCSLGNDSLIYACENMTFIEEEFSLDSLMRKEKLRRLVLSGCKIDTLKPLLTSDLLESVSLGRTTVSDKSIEDLKNRVDVSEKDDDYPIR